MTSLPNERMFAALRQQSLEDMKYDLQQTIRKLDVIDEKLKRSKSMSPYQSVPPSASVSPSSGTSPSVYWAGPSLAIPENMVELDTTYPKPSIETYRRPPSKFGKFIETIIKSPRWEIFRIT